MLWKIKRDILIEVDYSNLPTFQEEHRSILACVASFYVALIIVGVRFAQGNALGCDDAKTKITLKGRPKGINGFFSSFHPKPV
ncbi:hypothetical protein [Desulfonatronum thioautotrophicum]|uniref:hypothetical protein n=1 Tax=Desulfonatronum thioautotrophicum TaxID=617001 RepID=UPI0005EBEF06|nr:hypothetical protein [Desulfonatronum thioautotrophicum]